MIEVHIEQVASTDLAEVIQLFTAQVYPRQPEEAYHHFAGHAEGQADTFLASVAGELVGYLTIRWHSNNPQFHQHNIPLIHHLAVFPQFQRQGIASRLMERADDRDTRKESWDHRGPLRCLWPGPAVVCQAWLCA